MPAALGYNTANSRLRTATASSIIKPGMPGRFGSVASISLSSGMPPQRLTSVADVTQDQAQKAGPKHQCVVGLHQPGSPPYTAALNPVSSPRLASPAARLNWAQGERENDSLSPCGRGSG